MAALGGDAVKSLVRRLLVRVHPDVVLSQGKQKQVHNEQTLKIVLEAVSSNTNSNSRQALFKHQQQKIFFHTREGSRTATVSFDPFRPDVALRQLLGEDAEDITVSSRATTVVNQQQQDSVKPKLTKQDYARIFSEAMREWASDFDHFSTMIEHDQVGKLFSQNRIRFISNALDALEDVDATNEDARKIETKDAVELIRDALTLKVEESTLKVLQHPVCQTIEFVIVGKNLDAISLDGKTLFIPLNSLPTSIARAIDKVIDDTITEAVEKQKSFVETKNAHA